MPLAEWSHKTPVKNQDYGLFTPEIGEPNLPSLEIRQREIRRRLADLDFAHIFHPLQFL
jgi:hypothetical protein